MKIKRIEIVGFKSFVDKVALDIPPGVTGVVGPNGCGKSNIVDAIRWAMGEQSAKNLRGRAMEEVIFGGSEARKPHGMAEVSIVFDNTDGLAPPAYRDYSEIMVTRRLFRNGDSDYLLNKTACRLLDIAELFLDTGIGKHAYSIIEQGKIGMILNAKPEERRFLIEEAAGVSKFKARKITAQRKIEATKQNLLRLSDIVSEVRRQLGSLKRQAQRAERYRRLREELKGVETAVALHRFHHLLEIVKNLSGEEKLRQEKHAVLCGQLQQAELQLDTLRLKQAEGEKELNKIQEQVFACSASIQEAEGKIAFSIREQENLSRQKERMAQEAVETEGRLQQSLDQQKESEQESEEIEAALLAAKTELATLDENVSGLLSAEADKSRGLDTLRSQLMQTGGNLSKLQASYDDQQRRLDLLKERWQRNHQEASEVKSHFEAQLKRESDLSRSLADARAEKGDLQKKEGELKEKVTSSRSALEFFESELLERREELSRVRSRLESLRQLEKNLEGYGQGVRSIAQHPEWGPRFAGILADFLEVPGDLEIAVEAVLGERLQGFLADNVNDVAGAVAYLNEHGGRCLFLLSRPEEGVTERFPSGSPLLNFVGCRDDRATALLKDVYLVDDVRAFDGPLPLGVTLVTRGGDVCTHRGEWSGGGAERLGAGLLHQKREMRELETGMNDLQKTVTELQEQRRSNQEQLAESESELQQLVAVQHRQAMQMVDFQKDLERIDAEKQRLESRVELLSQEETQLHSEGERYEALRDEAAAGMAEAEKRRSQLQQELDDQQRAYQTRRAELEAARESLTAGKVKVAGLSERDEAVRQKLSDLKNLGEELRGRLAMLQSRQQEADEEKTQLAQQQVKFKTELEVLFQQRNRVKQFFDQQRDRFEEQGAVITESEARVRQLRQAESETQQALNAVQLDARERQLELDHLRQSFQEKYRLDLADLGSPEPDHNQEMADRRIGELRRMLEGIGEVNLTAIGEYEELDERYAFLVGQQDDLRRSLEGLQAAITKINRTTRKRFQETFEAVNEQFKEVFPRLFRGGQAELRLTDEDNLLESGIDIVAQPPGKKLQNVGLLSGGEKALTAVALIFSIFLIKPSPFCLLDEVDAPLDEANIGRFNALVQEMSERSQFIIITHNQRTMKIADTLYGITMEEPGVSKMVSARMTDYH